MPSFFAVTLCLTPTLESSRSFAPSTCKQNWHCENSSLESRRDQL